MLTRTLVCCTMRLLSPGGLYSLVLVCNSRVSPDLKRKEIFFVCFKYISSWYCSPHIVLSAILGRSFYNMTFSSGERAKGRVREGHEPCSPLSPLVGISFKREGENGLQKVILKSIHTSVSCQYLGLTYIPAIKKA